MLLHSIPYFLLHVRLHMLPTPCMAMPANARSMSTVPFGPRRHPAPPAPPSPCWPGPCETGGPPPCPRPRATPSPGWDHLFAAPQHDVPEIPMSVGMHVRVLVRTWVVPGGHRHGRSCTSLGGGHLYFEKACTNPHMSLLRQYAVGRARSSLLDSLHCVACWQTLTKRLLEERYRGSH